MLLKSQSNTEVVNEILDLYRFIVDKYAGLPIMMADGQQSVVLYLVSLMDQLWNHY